MQIPTYDQLMYPVLVHASEKTWPMGELIKKISDDLDLSPDDRAALLPGGSATIIGSRVHWAKTYLKKAGLVSQPARAEIAITPAGKKLLAQSKGVVDVSTLKNYPEFNEFWNPKPKLTDTAFKAPRILSRDRLPKSRSVRQ